VGVKVTGTNRSIIFGDVVVRVSPALSAACISLPTKPTPPGYGETGGRNRKTLGGDTGGIYVKIGKGEDDAALSFCVFLWYNGAGVKKMLITRKMAKFYL
jgi:hypothetical protein